jgi:hypothetical protein
MFDDLPLFSGSPIEPVSRQRLSAPHNGVDTSIEAAKAISRKIGAIHLRIYRALELAEDGYTCDELEDLLGLKHQTCSPRMGELIERGYARYAINRNGEIRKRDTRSECAARIYFAVRR